MEKYDITDYLKDDKELQKAVIEEFLKEIAELKALKGLITVGSKQQYQCLQKIDELEQENERLKEEVRTEKIYSSQIEELEESIVGQRNAYKKLNSQYIENCEYTKKLEETLQEIKAIAETYITDCQGFKCEAMEEIMQKITKAGGRMNNSFDILARENGKQIISFETKDSIRLEVYTENGKLIIDYHKWESEG